MNKPCETIHTFRNCPQKAIPHSAIRATFCDLDKSCRNRALLLATVVVSRCSYNFRVMTPCSPFQDSLPQQAYGQWHGDRSLPALLARNSPRRMGKGKEGNCIQCIYLVSRPRKPQTITFDSSSCPFLRAYARLLFSDAPLPPDAQDVPFLHHPLPS